MKNRFLSLLVLLASVSGLTAQGTGLTYQGRLDTAVGPAHGSYDFQFTVRDALTGGSAVGVNPIAATLAVTDGLFTVTLDPGPGVFTGANRWLEIAVRTNGAGLFTTLSPRQSLKAVPYAITAAGVSGSVPAAQLSGTLPLAQLPTAVVTNGAAGIGLAGTFSGNGAGLTILPATVARLDAGQTFAGTNAFAQSVTIQGVAKAVAGLEVVGGEAPVGAPALSLKAPSGSQGKRAIAGMWSTFTNTADQGARRAADLVAGFDGGAWGTEYLALHAGNNGTPNDASALTSEKLRVTASGHVGIGTTRPSSMLEVAGTVTAPVFNGTFRGNGTDLTGIINVRNPPYLAKGDGTNDDTQAIQNALFDAYNHTPNHAGIVFLPSGKYRIAGHLMVPSHVTLCGVWRAPQGYWGDAGTVLLATEGAGSTNGAPFISLSGPNVLEGLTIFYPEQIEQNPPLAYPWTIQCGVGAVGVTILNVTLVNPYLGIDLATYPSGRHIVRGVFGQPLLVGIAVDRSLDIGRIMTVHFWPFWSGNPSIAKFQSDHAVSFDFMAADWEVVHDIFSWGYHIGARFRASIHAPHACNGQFSQINFDNVDIGIELSDTQIAYPVPIDISQLHIANNGAGETRVAIRALPSTLPNGRADLQISGASFWGASTRQVVSWNTRGLLSMSGARFFDWDNDLPAIDLIAGRAMLQGNFFKDGSRTAIRVGTNTDRVMIVGNQLAGNTNILHGPQTLNANNQ